MNNETYLPEYELGFWEVRPIHDNTPRWRAVNMKTGEEHIAYSYASANFLCNLFNEQSRWYYYKNRETLTISDKEYTFYSSPPKANWRFILGEESQTYFQFYLKKGPNAFQRWLYRKVFGIYWERVEE